MGREYLYLFRLKNLDEKYPHLVEFRSFDDIWEDYVKKGQMCIYIVTRDVYSFILLVEEDVYYVIDTYGYPL